LAAAVAYAFVPLPAMAPLGAGRSPYALPVAGRPLAVHIAERIAERRSGSIRFLVHDRGLAAMQDLLSALAAYGDVVANAADAGDGPTGFPARSGDDLPLRQPWHLLSVQEEILRDLSPGIADDAHVEDGVQLEGAVRVESGARIYAGARIKGPVFIGENVTIGNNALVRGASSLAAGSVVGFCGELKNSLVAERFGAGPLTFVADSVADHDCFLGGLTRLSNYRLDGGDVEVLVDGRRRSTGRRQFGVILGPQVSLGIGCIVYPGRHIGAGCRVDPRVNVVRNLPAGHGASLEQTVAVTPLATTASKT